MGSPLKHSHTQGSENKRSLKGPQRGVFTLAGVRDHFRPRNSSEGRRGENKLNSVMEDRDGVQDINEVVEMSLGRGQEFRYGRNGTRVLTDE